MMVKHNLRSSLSNVSINYSAHSNIGLLTFIFCTKEFYVQNSIKMSSLFSLELKKRNGLKATVRSSIRRKSWTKGRGFKSQLIQKQDTNEVKAIPGTMYVTIFDLIEKKSQNGINQKNLKLPLVPKNELIDS